MKLVSCIIVGFLTSILTTGNALAENSECAAPDPGFQAFLPRFEEGINRFINGNPTLWKQNASQRDDAMIMGAWGAFEKGWKEVDARYDWAAARFKNSGAKVAIERSEVHLVDQDKPIAMALRTNHIFRKEEGAWKLVLRHADPLIAKTAPAAVLQR